MEKICAVYISVSDKEAKISHNQYFPQHISITTCKYDR